MEIIKIFYGNAINCTTKKSVVSLAKKDANVKIGIWLEKNNKNSFLDKIFTNKIKYELVSKELISDYFIVEGGMLYLAMLHYKLF